VSVDTPELIALRAEVRAFLRECIAAGDFVPQSDSWQSSVNIEFSKKLAARGWVGMSIPVEYGGQGKGALERFVVTEELLAHGAPVAAHWIADRQMVAAIMRNGTEEQRRTYLPGIASGERYFCIGMSEPDSGSDLASVR
jgi:alkylation response protein AidB-like acyl-CoA dehydrogenase